jgi:NADH:ubiquinone oxidoreductase subunit H
LSFVWFISGLAESNRTRFNFAESESEFVSVFNVACGGGGGFALNFCPNMLVYFMRLLFLVRC